VDNFLEYFRAMSFVQAAFWLLVTNLGLFAVSIGAGQLLVWLFHNRPVTDPPDPVQWQEWALAASCVLLNTAVAIAGWWLWQRHGIRIMPSSFARVLLDVVVLFFAMDFLMYVFHRLAHVRWVFPLVHATHHRYDRPRPLNLFVLNPAEVLGFGALWLMLLCIYPATWTGIIIYLTINLIFGTLGHLGVEPFPRSISRWPILRHMGSSTFHANHHGDRDVNFGFYTDLWDRLFRM
jgi:Delta7-sterol 5-desaturase